MWLELTTVKESVFSVLENFSQNSKDNEKALTHFSRWEKNKTVRLSYLPEISRKSSASAVSRDSPLEARQVSRLQGSLIPPVESTCQRQPQHPPALAAFSGSSCAGWRLFTCLCNSYCRPVWLTLEWRGLHFCKLLFNMRVIMGGVWEYLRDKCCLSILKAVSLRSLCSFRFCWM